MYDFKPELTWVTVPMMELTVGHLGRYAQIEHEGTTAAGVLLGLNDMTFFKRKPERTLMIAENPSEPGDQPMIMVGTNFADEIELQISVERHPSCEDES